MNAAFWVVVIALGFRLVFAGLTGLGIDESYMVAASRSFDASYFDHPLASWWLELGARALSGSAAPIVVRLPFVALSAVSSWLIYAITARLYGARAAFWAVVAYSISPVFSLAFGCWVLPDGPLDAALLAFLYAVIRALGLPDGRPSPRWWLLAGAFGGLALLSKYSAALVLAGTALAVLSDKTSRRELRRFGPWLSVLIAVLLFTPVLYWNATHGWASFHYQGGRATGLRLRPGMPLTIWGGEALFLLPWLWLPMVWLMLRGLAQGPAERRSWLLAWAAVIPVVLFSVVGLWSSTRILYHWATPGYLMLFPLLGNWAQDFRSRLRDSVAAVSAGLLGMAALFIAAEISLGFIPALDRVFAPGKSPLLQAVDWDSLATQIPPGVDAIAAQKWFDAGKIGYALRNSLVTVTVFGVEPHQFAFSAPPSSLLGKNVLVIAMPGSTSATAAKFAGDFQSFEPGPALTVMHRGTVLLVIPTFIGTDMLKTP
ncbi:glycosyltransferase family 39 protein [Acidocella aromatica]|uniref:4-amino-4-deoxy-L-arabinose transferase-like glycosyltransferase n=1 Tax=Acidocella aromatica TaxID=1303579 RepID=A0A840VBT0_9PROT|nr:glycosyltransferase family 39 protein [Acidocella aromatica]MBB5372297.1 4-amino-4-deoxy-L-arabinose transferase-like glycosyltransferase [Acidocella aromatica]